MTESQFVNQNIDQWRELEELLKSNYKDPDRLQELFIKVSNDLAYAKTYFPNRSVRLYLNGLTQGVFNIIDKKRTTFSFRSLIDFYRNVLPYELFHARKELLYSFLIFTISVMIGVLSSMKNTDFPKMILGDDYIEMTEENINDGDPMRVYKDAGRNEMFFYITFNNIRVSFLAFVLGILGSLGTAIVLINNGIMLGAFQYFFYKKGLFLTSFMTIWIHGTIEISAIIIAGAAGFVLGRGVLFPGTYSRNISIQKSALRAVRIIAGIIPLFIIAGFLESFVTRLTSMPFLLKLLIIVGSLAFIIIMYIIYPRYRTKSKTEGRYEVHPSQPEILSFQKYEGRTLAQNIELSLAFIRNNLSQLFRYVLLPAVVICSLAYIIWISVSDFRSILYDEIFTRIEDGGIGIFFVYWVLSAQCILFVNLLFNKVNSFMFYYKKAFIGILILCFPLVFTVYFLPLYAFAILVIIFPFQSLFSLCYHLCFDDTNFISTLRKRFSSSYINYWYNFIPIVCIFIVHFIIYSSLNSAISTFLIEFISYHDIFSNQNTSYVFFVSLITVFIHMIMLVFYQLISLGTYFSNLAVHKALDLKEKLNQFGKGILDNYAI